MAKILTLKLLYFDKSAVITDFTCVLNAILCNSWKNYQLVDNY